jgi:hypothetical protein
MKKHFTKVFLVAFLGGAFLIFSPNTVSKLRVEIQTTVASLLDNYWGKWEQGLNPPPGNLQLTAHEKTRPSSPRQCVASGFYPYYHNGIIC